MKTFKENLKKFCEEMNESEAGVMQLANLSEDEFNELVTTDSVSRTLLIKFCVNSGISITSIYSDEGFKMDSIEHQYAEYPTSLKQIISRLFCKQLIRTFCEDSETIFKVQLKLTKIGSQVLNRILSGKGCFSPADFDEIYTGMSSIATSDDCKFILTKCVHWLIPNYNLSVLKNYFKISYKQISTVLGISASAISNWGSIGAVPVPECYYKKLAHCLGEFTEQEFSTQLLSASDYAGRKYVETAEISTSQESAEIFFDNQLDFIDPPTDEPTETPSLIKPPAKKKKTKRSKTKPAKQRKPKSRPIAPSDEVIQEVSPAEISDPKTSTINITDEMITKMYNRLHTVDKMKVNSLIIELFFAQL